MLTSFVVWSRTRPVAFGIAMSVLFVVLLEVAITVGFVTIEDTDVGLYRHYGEAIAGGAVPYRDISIEYPPGALPLFVAPAVLTSTPEAYRLVFKALMVLAIAALVVGVRRLQQEDANRGVAAVAATVVLIAILGSVALTRFDVVPAALTVGVLVYFVQVRWGIGAVLLGIAIATKLYPAVLPRSLRSTQHAAPAVVSR
ncbi:MAG: DUF2029 domain-containing protein [Actinobacteria bacterium]|nr:DUF2029 domain-containing protein [Actinomycetota bacterium]